LVSIDELSNMKDARLAEKVLPLRMVIGVGSFPYRKQVEEVRRALNLKSSELARHRMAFAGFNVERRRQGPDSSPLDKWENADVLDTARRLAQANGKRFVVEDTALKPVIIPGFALRLPEQFPSAQPYPHPEVALIHLSESLKTIAGGDRSSETIPEYCLVRFFDLLVDGGEIYEYRIQMRMADPVRDKDSKAANEPLVSPWVQLPGTVTIPSDFAFYVVDQKELDPKHFPSTKAANRDQAAVQLHRWLDQFDPFEARLPQPIGDWAIAERVLVHAGEYIGGTHTVELPIWNWKEEQFILASDPNDRRTKRVPVAFPQESEIAPILVSFSGGQVEFNGVQERVPRELLVLMPNGRLAVRNSTADTRNPERLQQYHAWRRRVDDIKSAAAKRK
jgi:hypothetical protein